MWFSSAELYDPVTGTFTPTGSMTIERAGPTATLLPGGKVLVAGGDSGDDGPILNVESYEPSTGVFSFAGKTGFPSSVGPTIMSVLANGKVLIDMILYDRTTPDVQLYDPATMTFTFIGSMTAERSFSSTLLSNGTVLTAGDWSADIYDPVTTVFSRVGELINARRGHTATLLSDGTVLLAGGSPTIPASTYLNSAELFHPAVLMASPVLYALPGGTQAAIWHAATGEVVASGNPAVAGEALSMYTSNLIKGGVIPPQVAIGGRVAKILYFGDAPGYPGYYQTNFRMPEGVTPGPAVPVVLNYLGRSSNPVTITVQ
jgi:hypothetical protein